MSNYNWGVDLTIVAGADLSAKQYYSINVSGVLSTSQTNFFGIQQGKSKSGDHAQVRVFGFSKAFAGGGTWTAGNFIGQSNTTSGLLVTVTSGSFAVGRVVIGCASGGIATVQLFGSPTYLAL